MTRWSASAPPSTSRSTSTRSTQQEAPAPHSAGASCCYLLVEAIAGARNERKIYTCAVAAAMPADPPGDPPQLEDLLGEPWRAQVTALRRYVRRTRDVRVAELLSLAFEEASRGDGGAAGRHIAAAAVVLGTGSPAATGATAPGAAVPL